MASRTTVAGVQRLLRNLSLAQGAVVRKSSPPSFCTSTLVTRGYLTTATSTTTTVRSLALRSATSSNTAISVFPTNILSSTRSFSRKGKGDKKKKNDKNTKKNNEASEPPAAAQQHQDWVEFQKSISVDGFETGQTMEVVRGTKKRGGRRISQRKSETASKLEERLLERQRMTDIGSGQYPPLRYSDEETERLLALAYASIPPRAGKRGTRNLKRQNRRWHLVRKIRQKYKHQLAQHQERKMIKRSEKVKSVKAVLEVAPEICAKDREYQMQVFRRWSATMTMKK